MMRIMRTTIAIVAASIGIAALIGAALFPPVRLAGLALAMVVFFVVASLLSRAGQLAEQWKDLKGQTVSVRIWGAPPEHPAMTTFRVQSVRAIGPGLHFWVQDMAGHALVHLKVAQPGLASRTSSELRIENAAYVQWSGRRIPRREPAAALVLEIAQFSAIASPSHVTVVGQDRPMPISR